MQRISAFIVSAIMAVGMLGAHAAGGNPAAGESKSQTCASCHGENGASNNPTYTKLAGQYESYLYQSLKQYKSGTRENAIMSGMVASLSDQDMRDLAAYYAAQSGEVYSLPRNAPAE